MTAATQPYSPTSPIATHITAILGGAGALLGLIALVLMVCVISLDDVPTAPMNFAAILGATLAGASCMVWTGQRVIRHQTACFEANRAATKAETAAALKKVHKEVEGIRTMWQAVEVARVSAAIHAQETPARLGVVKGGGGNGVG